MTTEQLILWATQEKQNFTSDLQPSYLEMLHDNIGFRNDSVNLFIEAYDKLLAEVKTLNQQVNDLSSELTDWLSN